MKFLVFSDTKYVSGNGVNVCDPYFSNCKPNCGMKDSCVPYFCSPNVKPKPSMPNK